KICAVVPVKDTRHAKQRLAGVLDAARRRELALAMLEDVLAALAGVPELAGILVVTLDRAAIAIARRDGIRIVSDGAGAGHSGAVVGQGGGGGGGGGGVGRKIFPLPRWGGGGAVGRAKNLPQLLGRPPPPRGRRGPPLHLRAGGRRPGTQSFFVSARRYGSAAI